MGMDITRTPDTAHMVPTCGKQLRRKTDAYLKRKIITNTVKDTTTKTHNSISWWVKTERGTMSLRWAGISKF